MTETKTRPPLPKELRIERLQKMSLACRFGWHHWVYGERVRLGLRQERTCMKCGRISEVDV